MKLVGGTLRKGQLGGAVAAEFFQLYARYYAPTSLEVFTRDLASKSYSIVVRDPQGRIRGFSTVAQVSMLSSVGEIEVLFSGDTVVDRSFWGEQTLPFTWIEEAGRIKSERPEVPLYWLLITKGHRTFRYLPAFTHAYCPSPDPDLAGLRDEIAQHLFGDRFDGHTGLLKPDPGCPTALRPEFSGLEPGRAGLPHVQTFLSQNPGHARGEELVCLCELSVENLRPRARAQFLKGMG